MSRADDASNGSGGADGTAVPPDEDRPTWPAVGVALALVWLFVNGVALEPAALVGEFLVGLVFGLPLAYASRRFYWPEAHPWRLLRAGPYAVLYATAFFRVMLVANVDVAYRVLAPSMPIKPAVIDLPLRVETDIAVTTIANSISLTPGTLTMDHDEERNALTVHAIDGRDPASIARPIRQWEDYALAIFDERLKPGDPVPAEAALAADVDVEGSAEDGAGDGAGNGNHDGAPTGGGDADGR